MGKSGPTSSAPDGYGTISAKGYRRIWDTEQQRLRMEHVVVWERYNGTVPDGLQIHHIDHDKLNNDISNLKLVGSIEHKRMHSGCELRDGVWWKPCKICGQLKPVTNEYWYLSREGWPSYGRCKPCHISIVVASKRKRRSILR